MNLVVKDIEHLSEEGQCPIVIRFNSWLYRTEDGIVNGFFKEFYSGLKSQLDGTSINLRPLLKLSEQVAGMVTAIKPGVDLLFSPVAGAAVSKVGEAISSGNRVLRKAIEDPQSIEELRSELCDKLEGLDKHILIIIDDVDRLSPEEAIAVFRLIKSVGRLTNVIYLLAYDRKVADRMIKKIYPSEKGLYLEKIVQAGFDLPVLADSSIVSILESRFKNIFGNTVLEGSEHTFHIIDSIVVPEIKTPRDVHRLANIISVTYPSVKDDVNIEDFIAMETFRLFRPNLYQEIRSRKLLLTEAGTSVSRARVKKFFDNLETDLLSTEPPSERSRLKESLIDIFPSLKQNNEYSVDDMVSNWDKNKRVCSSLHFETYFRLSVSEDVISEVEFINFIKRVHDRKFVKEMLSDYITVRSGYGRTKASFMLDKIANSREIIDNDYVEDLLATLYEMLDDLDVDSDRRFGFGSRYDNFSRIRKISENLLTERFDLVRASEIMISVCEVTPLKYSAALCALMCRHYHLGNGGGQQRWVFLTESDARVLQKLTLTEIREYANENSIIDLDGLPRFLSSWHIITDDPYEVRHQFRHAIENDQERTINAARKFLNLFPDKSKDNNPDKLTLMSLVGLIDVEDFANKLNQIMINKKVTGDDRELASRLIGILAHVDPRWYRPESE